MSTSATSFLQGNSDFMATRPRKRQPELDEGRFKTVTLQDVAQVAGVTSMTVSRVIKGLDGVGATTRARVLRIAEELNYTANLSARALATGKTGVIAIISAGLNRFYYANIVHLLEAELAASGYQMRLLHTSSDLKDLVSSTSAAAVDGVIIVGKYHLAEEFRSLAPQVFQSCVFIDTTKHSETDYIHTNLAPAVEEALELMLKAGRTRLAYVSHIQEFSEATRDEPGYTPSPTTAPPGLSEERMRVYLSVMEGRGRPPELIGISPSFPLAPATLRQYFEAHGCPDGLLCVNDETAMYVYRALRDRGCRIPDDVLLVGCDGLPFMECFDPPLSTIAPPTAAICAQAWKFLQARIANPDLPLQSATFDARLIVRQSLQSPTNE